ncbi:hypothetical protein NMG60_11033626 [Bertholletia excelsa]
MESFNPPTGFRYNPNSNTNGDSDFSGGILDIFVHHARNIHNICIYDNQDVYAKFSLTYNPDETISTRIINGGGKNPEFNENLAMKVAHKDALLKCEIWMLSRAKNLMEDQLLGFALVPVSSIQGKLTQEFSLSSTDLFHSPAGTVKLTLSLSTNLPPSPSPLSSITNSSISSEVVLLDRKISEVALELDSVDYSNIEFPDINVARENQQMVSQYFGLAGHGSVSRPGLVEPGSFLQLGAASRDPIDHDYEMGANSSEENHVGSVSPSGNSSGFLSSTMTSLSDDRNSADCDSLEKKTHNASSSITTEATNQIQSPDTPTSKKGSTEVREDKESNFPGKGEEGNKQVGKLSGSAKFGQVFSAPLGNINLDAEQSAMQQQIVDMYMKSMQQFTESLAKMKLPMDLNNKPQAEDNQGDVIQNTNSHSLEVETKKKKDGSRVFYGSRAFF